MVCALTIGPPGRPNHAVFLLNRMAFNIACLLCMPQLQGATSNHWSTCLKSLSLCNQDKLEVKSDYCDYHFLCGKKSRCIPRETFWPIDWKLFESDLSFWSQQLPAQNINTLALLLSHGGSDKMIYVDVAAIPAVYLKRLTSVIHYWVLINVFFYWSMLTCQSIILHNLYATINQLNVLLSVSSSHAPRHLRLLIVSF